MSISRRTVLKATVTGAALGGIGAPFVARAQTAEFSYKYANNLPDTHPLNVRAKEMAAAIKAETNGKFDLQIFPNNQLGSDTDMLSQIRSGGGYPRRGEHSAICETSLDCQVGLPNSRRTEIRYKGSERRKRQLFPE
jgi:hypothetical protein